MRLGPMLDAPVDASMHGCGMTMLLIGGIVVAAGLGRTWMSWSDHRARRRALAAAKRAREIDAGVEPGTIVCLEGKVKGGSTAGTSAAGLALYGDHLLVEDARGRIIVVGVPGRREARHSFQEGETVFAVGELAAQEGGPYRSTHKEIITGGRSRSLWIGYGTRRAVMLELEGSFVQGGPFEGIMIMAAGALIVMAGLLVGL